jgi:hypothetical protein
VHPNDGVPYVNRHLDLLYNKHKIVSQLQPESICEIGVRLDFDLWIEDSQGLESVGRDFDFWHIDGDHSAEGTVNDLALAVNNGAKWMLVDDYGRIPETGQGTDNFLTFMAGAFSVKSLDEYQLLITRN